MLDKIYETTRIENLKTGTNINSILNENKSHNNDMDKIKKLNQNRAKLILAKNSAQTNNETKNTKIFGTKSNSSKTNKNETFSSISYCPVSKTIKDTWEDCKNENEMQTKMNAMQAAFKSRVTQLKWHENILDKVLHPNDTQNSKRWDIPNQSSENDKNIHDTWTLPNVREKGRDNESPTEPEPFAGYN